MKISNVMLIYISLFVQKQSDMFIALTPYIGIFRMLSRKVDVCIK